MLEEKEKEKWGGNGSRKTFLLVLFNFVFQDERNKSILWTSGYNSVEEKETEVVREKRELLENWA